VRKVGGKGKRGAEKRGKGSEGKSTLSRAQFEPDRQLAKAGVPCSHSLVVALVLSQLDYWFLLVDANNF